MLISDNKCKESCHKCPAVTMAQLREPAGTLPCSQYQNRKLDSSGWLVQVFSQIGLAHSCNAQAAAIHTGAWALSRSRSFLSIVMQKESEGQAARKSFHGAATVCSHGTLPAPGLQHNSPLRREKPRQCVCSDDAAGILGSDTT